MRKMPRSTSGPCNCSPQVSATEQGEGSNPRNRRIRPTPMPSNSAEVSGVRHQLPCCVVESSAATRAAPSPAKVEQHRDAVAAGSKKRRLSGVHQPPGPPRTNTTSKLFRAAARFLRQDLMERAPTAKGRHRIPRQGQAGAAGHFRRWPAACQVRPGAPGTALQGSRRASAGIGTLRWEAPRPE